MRTGPALPCLLCCWPAGDTLIGRLSSTGFHLVRAADTVELAEGDRLVAMGEQL